jgi:hypothetical protein
MDGLLITSSSSGLVGNILYITSAGTLAIFVGSKVILSGCLMMLTQSEVNVDVWHGGMYA